jgi:L,D-transpeptidase YbiS
MIFVALQVSGWVLARMEPAPPTMAAADQPRPVDPKKLAATNAGLEKRLAALAPKGAYIVIDTASNRVFLREGEKTLREMIASCGSGNVLEDPVGGRTWTFETPRGVFSVKNKINNPLWIKPDWAFIEEGEEIPKNPADRAEPGMMGDYAMGIGQGYFIHGTLYKRLLGRNVSHGCIRLGDEDLKSLVKTVPLGTRVIIF